MLNVTTIIICLLNDKYVGGYKTFCLTTLIKLATKIIIFFI